MESLAVAGTAGGGASWIDPELTVMLFRAHRTPATVVLVPKLIAPLYAMIEAFKTDELLFASKLPARMWNTTRPLPVVLRTKLLRAVSVPVAMKLRSPLVTSALMVVEFPADQLRKTYVPALMLSTKPLP